MKVGISTYAYRWEFSNKAEKPIGLKEMLERTKNYGAEVFQICDYPLIEQYSTEELALFAKEASELGIELELGTQGIHPDHLRKYLKIANGLGSNVLRSMLHGAGHQPSLKQSVEWLKEVALEFENAGVSLALETYEPIKSADLVNVAKAVGNPYIGVCLDPGNSIAELEFPEDVINNAVPYMTNLHMKDFLFKRGDNAVGFVLTGCPLGEGQLDIDYMLKAVQDAGKDPNAIIELWLPFMGTLEETSRVQDEWIQKSVDFLKEKIAQISSVKVNQ